MQTATNNQTPPKKISHRASVSGGILAILGWIFAGIGSLLIHARYHSDVPVTTTAEKVGDAVGNGTLHILSVLLGMPLLVVGSVLAGLSIILTLLRLRKVRFGGLLLSVIWLALSAWAIQLVIAAFELIKARPA